MGVVGITAEYNPFHYGHAYHLQKSCTEAGDDGVVVVMSGDFVQRGSAAVFSKFVRAEAAVRSGASLVIELPLPWCLASAEGFARGAVGLMQATGVVDTIAFGCECGDVGMLKQTASALLDPALDALIRAELKNGISYAAARERAVEQLSGESVSSGLRRPNDLLAVEYLKACRQLKADLVPLAICRDADSVHDGIGSASEIRAAMEQGRDFASAIPEPAMAAYHKSMAEGMGPVLSESLRVPILSRLRALSYESFSGLPDASEGIENRLYEAIRRETGIENIAMATKSKRFALSRIRRMTMAAALGLRREHGTGLPPYIRVLGMDERGKALLRRMSQTATLPVIVKPAMIRELDSKSQEIFALGSAAHDLYVLGYSNRIRQTAGADWRTTPYIK